MSHDGSTFGRQNLRVLHVVASARRRGAEVFASDLIRHLGAAGVHQRAAVLWGSRPLDVDYEAPVTILSEEAGGGAGGWVERVRTLRRDLAAWPPDVVLVHGGDALEHMVLADPLGRAPVIYRNIGLAGTRITGGARRRVYALVMRRPRMVVAVAEAVADQAVRTFGVPAHRVVTIPNGVDPERLRPVRGRGEVRHGLGISDSVTVVLTLGALSWEKDPLTQVEVAAGVIRERPEVFFVLAGDGPLRAETEAEVRRRGLDGRVFVLGSRDDVADLLAASDVLLLASLAGGMEGMPAVVIEAGFAALPVVAYDVAGVAEVVIEGVTGLLAAPGDVAGLVARLLRLLGDGGARAEMGEKARQRCAAHFDIHDHLPRYLRLCEEVSRVRARR